jgi:hypothetical protein
VLGRSFAGDPGELGQRLPFRNLARNEGCELVRRSGPRSAASCLSRACICHEPIPALIEALSLPTISFGVPAGAMTLVQELAMKSGKPLSIMVGTSGRSGSRARVATARALIFFSCRWPNSTDVVSNPAWICPASMSVSTAEAPL